MTSSLPSTPDDPSVPSTPDDPPPGPPGLRDENSSTEELRRRRRRRKQSIRRRRRSGDADYVFRQKRQKALHKGKDVYNCKLNKAVLDKNYNSTYTRVKV